MDVASAPLHVALADWQGMRHTLAGGMMDCAWAPDRTGYPHLSQLITDLRAMQVVSVLPVLPLVDMDSELFREAAVRGHCLVGPKGHVWEDQRRERTAAWLDLSRPQTVDWIAGQLRDLLDKTGAEALMARLDMPFPEQAAGEGGDAYLLRNGWGARWMRLCRDVLAEREIVRVFPDLPMQPVRQPHRGRQDGNRHHKKIV
jgi:alpha-glucosidase (family GH31 glycosyl hydrolase)